MPDDTPTIGLRIVDTLAGIDAAQWDACALAPGAVAPIGSGIKYFREDFERHIRDKRCPWKH